MPCPVYIAGLQLCYELSRVLQECGKSRFYPLITASTLVLAKSSQPGKPCVKLVALEHGNYWSEHGVPHIRDCAGGPVHVDDVAAGVQNMMCHLSTAGPAVQFCIA